MQLQYLLLQLLYVRSFVVVRVAYRAASAVCWMHTHVSICLSIHSGHFSKYTQVQVSFKKHRFWLPKQLPLIPVLFLSVLPIRHLRRSLTGLTIGRSPSLCRWATWALRAGAYAAERSAWCAHMPGLGDSYGQAIVLQSCSGTQAQRFHRLLGQAGRPCSGSQFGV